MIWLDTNSTKDNMGLWVIISTTNVDGDYIE